MTVQATAACAGDANNLGRGIFSFFFTPVQVFPLSVGKMYGTHESRQASSAGTQNSRSTGGKCFLLSLRGHNKK